MPWIGQQRTTSSSPEFGMLSLTTMPAGWTRWARPSPPEEPKEHEVESVSAVMALQHADWIGLALGVVQRGPGSDLDPELVQADIERLEEVEGEIEDSHLAVLDMALLHLTPRWQDLGVLD